MNAPGNFDVYGDGRPQEATAGAVKLENNNGISVAQQLDSYEAQLADPKRQKPISRREESDGKKDSNAPSTGHSSASVVDQGQSPMDDSTSPICPAPLCRQFWKAGSYHDDLGSKTTLHGFKGGNAYMHIHPKFLHSNATSHKWVFGAIAELVDNAIDEIQNGATFVLIDRLKNPRDGSQALLIQDDGGGMDPEAMRRCMSFGFSDKKSAIGQYGNGFKTSTMRLGADVLVFSRRLDNRTLTQSIGLLSYTFLTKTGHDRIVVPMVDYEFNKSTTTLEPVQHYGRDRFMSNLSLLLRWSPYSTEAELLKLFDDIGYHGTKVVLYNLWCGDDGKAELDFDSDPEDIRIAGETKSFGTPRTERHIAFRFHYSLRAYLSILYREIPYNFRILLRGQIVQHHNIADDLKFPEFIKYEPHNGGCVEGLVVTTIGFVKEAPHVNVHGFNVYHKNRLILPFWKVLRATNSRGRGVVGVLEANFIQPTHNKQDFEKTSLFQKLEARLKEMTVEYWDYHAELIGYHVNKRTPVPAHLQGSYLPNLQHIQRPVILEQKGLTVGSKAAVIVGGSTLHSAATSSHNIVDKKEQSVTNFKNSCQGMPSKRTQCEQSMGPLKVKGQAGPPGLSGGDPRHNWEIQPLDATATQVNDQQLLTVMQENKKLHAQYLEYEKEEKELNLKLKRLQGELEVFRLEHTRLLTELRALDAMQMDRRVNR